MQYMIKTVKNYFIPHKGNSYTPHLLRERSLLVLFILAFILFFTSLGNFYFLKKTDFGATVLPAVLVDLTNEYRIENNLKPLLVNADLQKAALMKAKDMADNGYFAHTSPTGVSPWQWFSRVGYPFVYAGENLAINFSESSDVEKAWIASPTHHANLINEKFDETGIATYEGLYEGKSATFVVQLFGKRADVVTSPKESSNPRITKPEVKGESLTIAQAPIDPEEVAPVFLVNEKTFAVVQNLNENEPRDSDYSEGDKIQASTFVQRFIANQNKYVQYIYVGLMILVYIVLVSMIVMQLRFKHSMKHIALSILLLCLLGAFSYINSGLVVSFL